VVEEEERLKPEVPVKGAPRLFIESEVLSSPICLKIELTTSKLAGLNGSTGRQFQKRKR